MHFIVFTKKTLTYHYFQAANVHLNPSNVPQNFTPAQFSYGAQSAPQSGSQMYGYGTNTVAQNEAQQFHIGHNQGGIGTKRKREEQADDIDGVEMGLSFNNLQEIPQLKVFSSLLHPSIM